MEQTSIYKFYILAQLLNKFKSDEVPTHIELFNRLTNFFDFVDELNLKVTKSAITLSSLKKYYKILDEESKIHSKSLVDNTTLKKINLQIEKIITTFEAEIFNKNTYVVSEKKIPLTHLLEDITLLFENSDVILKAPFDVQFHVVESSYCLAFNRFTASAFHILLATEEYVRFFVKMFSVDSNSEEQVSTFYGLINTIEEILDELNYQNELVGFLHILRMHYRNQSLHYNRKFTETEATELFNICIKVMNEMYKIICLESPDYEDLCED